MSGEFPYGDIIVIAAIAAFIILRYRAMLGEKSGRDPSEIKAQPLKQFERVVQLPNRENEKVVAITPDKDYGPLQEAVNAVKAIDKNFSADEFLIGAKTAFEMVVDAFNSADHETLQMLLSPEIYRNFKETLAQLDAQKRKQHTTLIAIVEAKLSEIKLTGTIAKITVHFISEQVILQRDADNNVVEGDPSQQHSVEDAWVFERALTSSDPAWKIIET